MTKMFLAALASVAIVALTLSAPAARQDTAVRTDASNGATHAAGSLIIRTDSDMSGYMVAVG